MERRLKSAIADSRDLKILLGSPAFNAEAKGKGLTAIAAKAKFNPTTQKFLGLLAANGRAAALPAVITAFEALSAKARGAVWKSHSPKNKQKDTALEDLHLTHPEKLLFPGAGITKRAFAR